MVSIYKKWTIFRKLIHLSFSLKYTCLGCLYYWLHFNFYCGRLLVQSSTYWEKDTCSSYTPSWWLPGWTQLIRLLSINCDCPSITNTQKCLHCIRLVLVTCVWLSILWLPYIGEKVRHTYRNNTRIPIIFGLSKLSKWLQLLFSEPKVSL